ncbi:MAG: glutathione S-transferase family protein [Alphaproteobacteria bacterium]
MPKRPAPNAEIAAIKGLHLFHAGPSHASQTVRQCLVEKSLEWTGTLVDLGKWEHATDWFQDLNPAGYVPVLVHDGEVWTESIDILLHLEDAFPAPALAGPRDEHWFELTETAHVPCRIVSHQFLFGQRRMLDEAGLADLARKHRNPELIAFMTEHRQGFSFARVRDAVRRIEQVFIEAEAALAGAPWLGPADRPGLADFPVATLVHRLTYAKFPVAEDYPRVADWFARVAARPQFQQAVVEPEGERFRELMAS